ncbi:hypothetical protein [Maribacter aestuarii]|uniref:hypothetical protein n=1 Tax=Maribacter aestuarii TaxID=1130723 RepID=UPI00248B4129|nr:hypothetical protein [Maribacter aestuarii]
MAIMRFSRIIILSYGIPLLVILISIALALSPLFQDYPQLAMGITYDLILTAPLLFLLLTRKSEISKLKAIPFFVGGIIIASYVLPENSQAHLILIKTYALPVVELTILTILILKIRVMVKAFRTNSKTSIDFHTLTLMSAEEVFGKSKFTALLASEVTLFYYTFFAWRSKKHKHDEFTSYKENGSIALAVAFLLVICIETFAFHILLMKWNATAAWILTGTSIYSSFMVIAHIKVLFLRPTILSKESLSLKNGLISDITIRLDEIDNIYASSKEMSSTETKKVGTMGIHKESTGHNVIIHLKTRHKIQKPYGLTQECDTILLTIDNKVEFVSAVKEKLDAAATV